MILFLIILSIVLIFLTYTLLSRDEEIKVSILQSYLLENEYNDTTTLWFLSLLFPISLTQYLILKKVKMKNILKSILLLTLLSGVVYIGIEVFKKVVNFSNEEIKLTNKYNSEVSNRTAIYDKLYKEISQNSQLAVKVDSSFKEVISIVMTNRKDGEALTWKWLQEANPTASYAQVADFYKNLFNVINSNREEFLSQDKLLSSINQDHEDLINTFPNSLYNTALGRPSFGYIPITSTKAEQVSKTHKDDDIKIFQ